jgi:hypothetical protein
MNNYHEAPMKAHRTIATLLVTLFFTAIAGAQIGLYAGFSGTHLNTPSGTSTIYGPLFGFYAQHGRPLAIGADVRASLFNHTGAHFNTIAVGPRIAIHPPVLPLKPYFEVLGGLASYGNSSTSLYFNYQFLGGVDLTILPRIDWRVIEYDYSALADNSANTKTLTTGVVLRLP